MKNQEIADIFNEIAEFLEFKNENVFRGISRDRQDRKT